MAAWDIPDAWFSPLSSTPLDWHGGGSTWWTEEAFLLPAAASDHVSLSHTSLSEARSLLAFDTVTTSEKGIFNLETIRSHLEPLVIERTGGELAANLEALCLTSSHVILVRLFFFCAYLSSNGLMSDRKTDSLVEWISQNGYIFLLGRIFRSRSLTAEVFIGNIFVSAARLGAIEMLKYLIQIGVNVNAVSGQYDRTTALSAAIVAGHSISLVELLVEAGADPNVQLFYSTHIQSAIYRKTDGPRIVDMLLKVGADPNEGPTFDGSPPLRDAVDQDSVEIVNSLLEAGADPNALFHDGKYDTVLQAAFTRAGRR